MIFKITRNVAASLKDACQIASFPPPDCIAGHTKWKTLSYSLSVVERAKEVEKVVKFLVDS